MDLIYRQQAIDALMERFKRVPTNAIIAKDTIENLPSAKPERKEGEWSDGYRWQRCSLCKQPGKKSWNYCPSCGADMRGERNE